MDIASVDLGPDIEQARRLLTQGRLTRAVYVFLELRREFPGHPALRRMPLAPGRREEATPVPTAVYDDRGTESITLYCPKVAQPRRTGPRRVVVAA